MSRRSPHVNVGNLLFHMMLFNMMISVIGLRVKLVSALGIGESGHRKSEHAKNQTNKYFFHDQPMLRLIV